MVTVITLPAPDPVTALTLPGQTTENQLRPALEVE
jgi:hypothetical protein